MKTKISSIIFCAAIVLFIVSACFAAENLKPIKLPPPQTDGGKPLMQALKNRRSLREFGAKELDLQVISDLLWAADGINRPDSGGRTSPTAKNMQEIDIYVAKSDGLYLYNAKANTLELVLALDIRAATGNQPFVKSAPANLVFVADLSKMPGLTPDMVDFYAATDTGFVSENVYLFCASAGLATVVRGWVDKPTLAKAMKLRNDQKVILAQTVGWPK